ncbi:leashin-like [Rosa rugosa]|uniref:leashin-like n=1 Tax=Rosa rugosa TaxID=74645 RepID=UPI002B409DE2|nr:leashin-like [Rosa rugosa]
MAVEDLCPPSSEICTVPNSESPEPDVELGCSRKKKKNKKKRCKLESNDKSCESPSLQSQFVQLSDQEAPQPLTEKSNTITDSENPQSNVEPSLSTKKKKKKKKGSKTTETNDTSCESPPLQPQLVQLSDQQASQPLAEKITTITDSESPQSNVELSLSQNKKKKNKKRKNKKGCKTPETNDKSCESPSIQPQLVQATDQEVEVPQRIEAVQPQLAQVTDQKLEVPQPIEDSSFSVKNKKRNGKKSRKPHDCNDEVCGVSVGTSIMESNMPAVDPYIKPSVEISLEQLVAEPLVEGMSTTANSKSPKSNADFGCSQEMKKKKRKRSHKTSEYKELFVETMMPEANPSFQPSIAMFSEQELEVSQPLNVDAESLVEGMSTTINSERPRPNADFNCSQETKKKKRKRGRKTSDSKEVLVEPMLPEAESSLRPSLTMLSEQELDVPQPLNADAEPLVEGMSTTIKSESTRGNADFTCSQETKKKKRKRGSKTSDSKELLVEVVTPEADPSLQPLLAIFSEHELEVPPPLTTDAEPLVEGMSMTMNSESLKPNADISCLEETKKKNSKRKPKTSESKKLSVEIMTPEPDPSLQPTLSEKELGVPQPLNTDAEPLVEGMSTTMNSGSPKPNADFSYPQETKKKNRKRKHKTSESKELLVEIMAPEADPSLQPTLSEKELQVPPPLNTDAEPLVEGMSTTINLESTRGNADFTCSQETKKKKQKRGSKTSERKELLVEIMTPEADPSLQRTLFEKEPEVPQPLNTDAEPLMEGMSTTMNSGSPKPNADVSCSQETKKKNPKRKRKTCESKELLVEIMTPEADPSLQPSLAIISEQEVEVPQPLNTDAQPLVEGVSTTNSESPKPNAEFSCSQETKKKNPKRNHKTNENKELLVEIMTPEADLSLQPPLAIFSEQEVEVAQPLNTGTVWKETKIDEVPSLSHLAPKADTEVVAIGREGNLSQKKLLILDINGLLADIVQMEVSIPSSFKPDKIISRKAVFKRPFCDDFLQFCFDRFNVGVWSSRTKENVNSVIDFLLGDSKHKLLFCWNQSHCTSTRFKTVENKNKPLVLKELRKLWEKLEPDLPWARGEYNESNTVLLDDSPYKALCNPVNTAIFPNSYQFRNRKDSSLGPGGDIRSYLEGLAMAESVQKYVEQNPFGQRPITKSNPSWNFYRRVIEDAKPLR